MGMGQIGDEYFQEIVFNVINRTEPTNHMCIVVCIDLSINWKKKLDEFCFERFNSGWFNENSQALRCVVYKHGLDSI